MTVHNSPCPRSGRPVWPEQKRCRNWRRKKREPIKDLHHLIVELDLSPVPLAPAYCSSSGDLLHHELYERVRAPR